MLNSEGDIKRNFFHLYVDGAKHRKRERDRKAVLRYSARQGSQIFAFVTA